MVMLYDDSQNVVLSNWSKWACAMVYALMLDD